MSAAAKDAAVRPKARKAAVEKAATTANEAAPAAATHDAAPRKPVGGDVATVATAGDNAVRRNKRHPQRAADAVAVNVKGHQKLPTPKPKDTQAPAHAAVAASTLSTASPTTDRKEDTAASGDGAPAPTAANTSEANAEPREAAAPAAPTPGTPTPPPAAAAAKKPIVIPVAGVSVTVGPPKVHVGKKSWTPPPVRAPLPPPVPAPPPRHVDPAGAVAIGPARALPPTHNMKLLCVLHGQLRFVNHMSRRADGTFVCNADKACKPEYAPPHLLAVPAAGRGAAGAKGDDVPPTHNIKKICSVHNQERYLNQLVPQGGAYACSATKPCRPQPTTMVGGVHLPLQHQPVPAWPTQQPSSGSSSSYNHQQPQPGDSTGASAAGAAAAAPRPGGKATCAVHKSVRLLSQMNARDDGTFTCKEGHECKVKSQNPYAPATVPGAHAGGFW